jgi:phosphopantothenoylcysteine decarboxylase/phosphopantothenate--cysteine ligase
MRAGHGVTLILGPVTEAVPPGARRIDLETSAEMSEAVHEEFPNHDVLIMAAAVADYRPKYRRHGKVEREGSGPLTIEFEPTEDIVAAAGRMKRPHQRTVAFSLEAGTPASGVERARQKMQRKGVDLMVYNPAATMNADEVESVLLYPDGRSESLPSRGKGDFADILVQRVASLF